MILIGETIKAIKAIMSECVADIIKDYDIKNLMNLNTAKVTGFGVLLKLNTKYDYDNEILESWRKQLKADSWYIHVRSNQLFVMFKIHTKKGGKG